MVVRVASVLKLAGSSNREEVPQRISFSRYDCLQRKQERRNTSYGQQYLHHYHSLKSHLPQGFGQEALIETLLISQCPPLVLIAHVVGVPLALVWSRQPHILE